MSEKLNDAVDEYLAAKEDYENSKDRKETIKEDIADAEEGAKRLSKHVNEFGEAAYKNGGLPPAISVLATGTPERAVEALSLTGYLGEQSGRQLQKLVEMEKDLKAQQKQLKGEIADAKAAKDKMQKARDAAAQDVAAAGGIETDGPEPGDFRSAEPAPRGPDGSLPEQGCSVDDPTTGGCLSPRMSHALNQAILAGFTRETSCYRSLQDGGDHPKGKACDFAAGNGGYAQGEGKAYGDHAAAWFEQNADALGVKGIIWYNELWTPATGWGAYPGGNTGDPSLDHADHVHVSIKLAFLQLRDGQTMTVGVEERRRT